MPIHRCPRCARRPLVGDERRCPSCDLDLEQIRADAALLMRPSREWRPPAIRVNVDAVDAFRLQAKTITADPEPIEGAVRDCPTCGAAFRFTERHEWAPGRYAAGWFCACGARVIERFACTEPSSDRDER